MRTFLKMIVAAIVALGMACVLVMHDASFNAIIVTYFTVAIMVCAVLGVFDIRDNAKTRHMNLRDAYRDAA